VALPFVQGRLRKQPVLARIETSCACCGRPLWLEINDQLGCRILDEGADPYLFIPLVDFDKLDDSSITGVF
jgi:hypothetical protein